MLHKIYILILFLAPLALFAQNKDLNLPELGDRVSGVISLEQERILRQGFLEQVYAQAPLIYDPIIQNTLSFSFTNSQKHHKLKIENFQLC